MYRAQRYILAMRADKVTKGKRTVRRKRASTSKDANLLVRCDSGTKKMLERAASVRGLSLSDYVRSRIVPLAKQDVEEADAGVLRLPREAQIAFWQALQNPPEPTEAQRELGRRVRELL